MVKSPPSISSTHPAASRCVSSAKARSTRASSQSLMVVVNLNVRPAPMMTAVSKTLILLCSSQNAKIHSLTIQARSITSTASRGQIKLAIRAASNVPGNYSWATLIGMAIAPNLRLLRPPLPVNLRMAVRPQQRRHVGAAQQTIAPTDPKADRPSFRLNRT